MANDDDNKNLSPEETAINDILSEASKQLEDIEAQIKNLPPDKGPVPELKLPGAPPIQRTTKAQKEAALRQQMEAIKQGTKGQATKIIETSNPDIQKKAGLQIEKWQNPDFKELEDKEDISQSQNFLLRKMTSKQPEIAKEEPQAENHNPEKSMAEDTGTMSMSSRFTMSLGYTELSREEEKELEPEKGLEMDKEDLDDFDKG